MKKLLILTLILVSLVTLFSGVKPAKAVNDCDSGPSVPSNLSAVVVSSTQIDLSWDASGDNVGVTGYKIYKDNVFVENVAASPRTYSSTGLTLNTTYAYKIRAFDGCGNNSAFSTTVNATPFSIYKYIQTSGVASLIRGTLIIQ